MEVSTPTRVLVVATRTAADERLIDVVRERAAVPARFTLLVPRPSGRSGAQIDDSAARLILDRSLPLLSEAAGSPVEGLVGDAAPLTAIEDVLKTHSFDEIILSTRPARLSRWLRSDLTSKVEEFGLPVTTTTPPNPRVDTRDREFAGAR